jgi:hypothetical protein
MLRRRVHNEDCWADVAPSARVVRVLSEPTELGSSLLSVVIGDCASGYGVSAL